MGLLVLLSIGIELYQRRRKSQQEAEFEAELRRAAESAQEVDDEEPAATVQSEPAPPTRPDQGGDVVGEAIDETLRRRHAELLRRAQEELERKHGQRTKERPAAVSERPAEEGVRSTSGSARLVDDDAAEEKGALTADDLRRWVALDAVFKRPEW